MHLTELTVECGADRGAVTVATDFDAHEDVQHERGHIRIDRADTVWHRAIAHKRDGGGARYVKTVRDRPGIQRMRTGEAADLLPASSQRPGSRVHFRGQFGDDIDDHLTPAIPA